MDGHPGRHETSDAGAAGINSKPFRPLDLDSALSHLWAAPKNPRSSIRSSFHWWRGKVGGDKRSFAEVAASPARAAPMAGGGGRGFRDDKRDGGGSGQMDRGAGRFDRGRKFSWQRNDGEADHASSNTVQSSGAADRWAAAAAGRQDPRSGGVWVEKPNASSRSGGGDNIDKQLGEMRSAACWATKPLR